MRTSLLVLFVCVFFSIGLYGQDNGFYAFDIKGDVYFKDKGVEKPAVRKSSVSKTCSVIIKANSSVILFREADGVPVNLKSAGVYNYKKLMELADASKPNVTSYFLDFCKTEIIKSHDKEINKGAGVVNRGKGDYPMLFPPDSSIIIDLALQFFWKPVSNSKKTYLIISDADYNHILKISSPDTTITVYPFSSRLEEGKTYFWIVTDKMNPLNDEFRYSFKISTTKQNIALVKKLEEFNKSLKFDDETNALLLARFYEENYLYREAYETYKAAVIKYPSNENIAGYYKIFLKKTGL